MTSPTVVIADDEVHECGRFSTRRAARCGSRCTGRLRSGGTSRCIRLALDAHIPGWARFLPDPDHPIEVARTIDIDGVVSAAPVTSTVEHSPGQR